MSRIKNYSKKKKYGVTWVYIDGTWFVNDIRDARKCGIYAGETTKQLNNPKYLKRISAKKKYWDKYIR